MSATLYIVATPIGHLDDISARAVAILKQVDLIAAEDTRHSARLLQHYAINTPVIAYHEHAHETQKAKILSALAENKSVALISDAGTPLISDPGYRLVSEAREQEINVVPIPGASAVTTALSAAGLPTDRFMFIGFLPHKQHARLETLKPLLKEPATLVMYETPHRIVDALKDMVEVFGPDRRICLARELTKTFETIKLLPLETMLEWVSNDNNQQKGEIVLVLEGHRQTEKQALDDDAIRLLELLSQDMPPKKASKVVASYCNVPVKAAYDYIISTKN